MAATSMIEMVEKTEFLRKSIGFSFDRKRAEIASAQEAAASMDNSAFDVLDDLAMAFGLKKVLEVADKMLEQFDKELITMQEFASELALHSNRKIMQSLNFSVSTSPGGNLARSAEQQMWLRMMEEANGWARYMAEQD